MQPIHAIKMREEITKGKARQEKERKGKERKESNGSKRRQTFERLTGRRRSRLVWSSLTRSCPAPFRKIPSILGEA